MEKKQDKIRIRNVILTFTLFFGLVAGCEHVGDKLEERDERKWQQEEMERIEDTRIEMIDTIRDIKQNVSSGTYTSVDYDRALAVNETLNELDNSEFEEEFVHNLGRLMYDPQHKPFQEETLKQLESVEIYLVSNQPRL